MCKLRCTMYNKRLWRLAGVLLFLSVLLTACGKNQRLVDEEPFQYSNPAGYRLMLPGDWHLTEEEEDSATFAAPEGEAGLTVVSELGGEAYYGLDEITFMLLDKLPEGSPAWQAGRVLANNGEMRRQVFSGEDESGATVYLDITVLQPHPGIRYYLLFAAGSAAYASESALYGEIADSFELEQNVQYLYALMEERRPEEEIEEETREETREETTDGTTEETGQEIREETGEESGDGIRE